MATTIIDMPKLIFIPLLLIGCQLSFGEDKTSSAKPTLSDLGSKYDFTDQGETRTYYVARPENVQDDKLVATVFCFHGGSGNLKAMLPLIVSLRDAGFQVITPVGLDGHWNDGRSTRKHAAQDKRIDDVAFVEKILLRTKGVDRRSVFAFGVSNGGMFTHRLAIQKRELFTAVAMIAAPLTVAEEAWQPHAFDKPLPVLLIMGREDPVLPFDGGKVVVNLAPKLLSNDRDWGQGQVQSAAKTLEFWLRKNGLEMKDVRESEIEDVVESDHCNATRKSWSSNNRLLLEYIEIAGGGHTVPGMTYPDLLGPMLVRVLGHTCMDFKATDELIRFFESHTVIPHELENRDTDVKKRLEEPVDDSRKLPSLD